MIILKDIRGIKVVNIIIENDLEDIVDGEEEIAALDRLNKAYEKFGKENIGAINE